MSGTGTCLHPGLSGTTGYKRGCRCARCRSENRAYVIRARNNRVKRGTTHGTTTGYGDGCRCQACKRADAEKNLRYFASNPDRYRENKRRASRQHYRRHDAKALSREQQQVTRDKAWRNHFQWTGPELEIALREDLTSYEAALMLGRTRNAVQAQRELHEVDPRKRALAGLDRNLGNGGKS